MLVGRKEVDPEIVKHEHLHFMHPLVSEGFCGWHCEIEGCNEPGINLYKRPDGSGIALCAKHDFSLTRDVDWNSPYGYEPYMPGFIRDMIRDVESRLDEARLHHGTQENLSF